MPTFRATSDVIGVLLARPRIPSVPKYRRVMGIPLARFCSLGLPFRELTCIGYPRGFPLASMVIRQGQRIAAPPRGSLQLLLAQVTRRLLIIGNEARSRWRVRSPAGPLAYTSDALAGVRRNPWTAFM